MVTKAHVTKLIKEGKNFCVLPWIHFHSFPNGDVMPCCMADSSKPVSKIKSEESIIQMMNSDEYKKMRVAMLKDQPLETCFRCTSVEQLGAWTMRNSHNTRRGLDYVDLISKTKKDGSIDEFKMKYMDIRFSNLCNMKCRTCGPACSSQWAEEYAKTKGHDKLEKYFGLKSFVVNTNEDQVFMTKLKPYLDHVEEVYFAGGEAIITPEHYECLDYWIEKGLTHKVELTYTTNFSVLKYKDRNLIELWKKFPNIKIWASLDASGDVAELVRKGTKWDTIVKNMKKLKKEVPHAEFQISPTISTRNVWSFPEFFDYLYDNELISKKVDPRFNLLTHPWWANIFILPDHIKEKLIKTYEMHVRKYEHLPGIANGFKLIQQNLKAGSHRYGDHVSHEDKGGILEFIFHNNEMDVNRKEKLLDVVPELKEVYQWAKK